MKTAEVGGETDAYCTKCKTDTGHVIVALAGSEVKRVECKSCGGQHNYRRPKTGAPAPKVKRAASTKPKRSHAAPILMDEASWSVALLRDKPASSARGYQFDGVFSAGEVIQHSTFGLGKIEDVLRNKMKVAFRAGQKLLICRDKNIK